MKRCRCILAILLCLSILLGCVGCASVPPVSTSPTGESGATLPADPTDAPSVPSTPSVPTEPSAPSEPSEPPTVPTQPAPTAREVYQKAREAIDQAQKLYLRTEFSLERVYESFSWKGDSVIRATSGSAVTTLEGIGTDELKAYSEITKVGVAYTSVWKELYVGGKAYTIANDVPFACDMDPASFVQRYREWLLPNDALYTTVESRTEPQGTVITLSDPTAPESWLADGEITIEDLKVGEAAITVGQYGDLSRVSYSFTYIKGNVHFLVRVGVNISTEPLASVNVEAPVTDAKIANLDIPAMLLTAMVDVYNADFFSAQTTDYLLSQALAMVRSQHSQFDSDKPNKKAKADYSVSVMDVTGKEQEYTLTEKYDDDFFVSTNGGEFENNRGVDWDAVDTYIRMAILDEMLSLEYIADAQIEDLGDYYFITFTGSAQYLEDMYEYLYTLLEIDLDSYATSWTDIKPTAYLSINKQTGLPVACGYELGRTHVIDDVPYLLTYKLDQSIRLYTRDASENVTGETSWDAEPEEKATPLFYKVTDAEGHVMWLLGTIHIGDDKTAYLPKEIYDAFNASDALAVEHDVLAFEKKVETDPALQDQISQGYFYSDGTKTQDHMDAELYTAALKLLYATGSYNMNMDYARPALWYNLLENAVMDQSIRYTSLKGVDMRLLKLAMAQEKKILDIETALDQTLMMVRFSEQLQELLLAGVVETDFLEYHASFVSLYDLWCEGDEAKLTEAMKDDTSEMTDEEKKLYEEYNKAISTDRNAHMLEVAKQYLASGETVFYAVGLAHLLVEDGLVNTLRDAGYTVELVTYQ